jgi:hypothetical protein
VPSANANTDARSLARIYGLLTNGGALDGVRLVSEASIAAHTSEQVNCLYDCAGTLVGEST